MWAEAKVKRNNSKETRNLIKENYVSSGTRNIISSPTKGKSYETSGTSEKLEVLQGCDSTVGRYYYIHLLLLLYRIKMYTIFMQDKR